MVQSMPDPFKHPKTGVYWYRQRTPRDVVSTAKGQKCLVEIDERSYALTVGEALKVSLRTKDPREATRRAKDVQHQFDNIWDAYRDAPIGLNHKQVHGLAGVVYRTFTSALEDEPGSPELWQHVIQMNEEALAGRAVVNPLAILKQVDSLEQRFGGFVDIVLRREKLRVLPESRRRLLRAVAQALDEAAQLSERRAQGDYREDENAKRFPEYAPPAENVAPTPLGPSLTFDAIIDVQVKHRAAGIGAKHGPLRENTITKYRRVCREFSKYRSSDFADTVTSDELEAWKVLQLTQGRVTARTVSDQIATIKTVIGWGVARFKKDKRLQSVGDELKSVELPGFAKKPSDVIAIRPEEAATILAKARLSSDDRIRWLPWLSAYTGARIGELISLEASDFIETGGYSFFKISTTGGRKVKNEASVRYVPVHPALAREGFLIFVRSRTGRLFSSGATHAVGRWFRSEDGAGITREGVSPNHGWRHLFEDLCIRDGVSDTAKIYAAGRYEPGSAGDYGKTWAMLPGLAREIEKIKPFST